MDDGLKTWGIKIFKCWDSVVDGPPSIKSSVYAVLWRRRKPALGILHLRL